ncbi:leucine-rich repeat and immunoglobulin-like domain-containing nogo receptor-interacting protein 1 [Limulus polyphemus]|uniref:Leucine-rich repeat and immunoglobulin-like domain-containing nogo receptor-interacting protein 1 n=1 Tax=Limulus polyphemus TaxID=6850 RepID=A0ABM1S4H5_LIMPO|nr:leucine-rich repeat and immunoglobulin-like domain-containing nogo receptor-interacting protein 1 [Limulus polyphemus]XP_022238530.1 leucine-rich repeat and immunoglobulin-like domain-containing nogo receptor-interacting protein 1 [Limulus polyphemus]
MQCLRGSRGIMVLLFYILCLWTEVSAMCPMRCKCDDQSLRVLCANANLDVVPITLNPELRELILNNNHIKGIMSSFSVYHNLEYLDVSHNQLVDLGEYNFKMQGRLEFLLLSSNMISSVHNHSFVGLQQLKVLHLNENFLEDVPSRAFVHLPNLETLDLSRNRIISISEDAFEGLENIRGLLLRDNKLNRIPSAAFQNVPTLLKLDFGLNTIREVSEGAFAFLRQLEELSLDGCGLRTIDIKGFQQLSSLLVLKLHDNELQEIPTSALRNVNRLEELNIGQNKFKELKPRSFQKLKYLRIIQINGSPMFTSIRKDSLFDNINLQKFIIAHNKNLNHIDSHTFDGLPNLRYVSFRGNAFTTFNYDLLPWDELTVLDVRDNPLACDCKLLWLWKLLRNKNFSSDAPSNVVEVHCTSPPGLKNMLLTKVTEEDLGCYIENRRQQMIIGIIVAAAIAVGGLVLLGFRYREKLAVALKNKWTSRRKEPQYQKTTCVEDESTVLQTTAQQSLKMTPVTEL